MSSRFSLLVLFLFTLATPAFAADIGFCATPEAMTATLKAEDQRSIVSAQIITADKHLFGLIVTMSADRKTGYIIRADQPLGDRASQLCVYKRMANIRLFDARKPGVDPAVLLKAPEADATKHCDELVRAGEVPKGLCSSLNTSIRDAEPLGQRVALQGFAVAKGGDGLYKPNGTLITVSGNVGGSIRDNNDHPASGILGFVYATSLPDGATYQNATLVYVEYTPYGRSLLD